MTDRRRRRVLQLSGAALSMGLAGCSSSILSGGGPTTPHTVSASATDQTDGTESDSTEPQRTSTPFELSDVDAPGGALKTLPTAPLPENPDEHTYPTMGSDDAPLKMTFYGAWKCPYTHNFVLGFLNKIIDQFVKPEKLQLEFQPVVYRDGEAFHGPDEVLVANAGFEVWNQDPKSFFRYMAYFYRNQVRKSGWYDLDKVVTIAKAANVSTKRARLKNAIDRYSYRKPIEATMSRIHYIPVTFVPQLYASPGELGKHADESANKKTVQGRLLAPNVSPAETIRFLKHPTAKKGDGRASKTPERAKPGHQTTTEANPDTPTETVQSPQRNQGGSERTHDATAEPTTRPPQTQSSTETPTSTTSSRPSTRTSTQTTTSTPSRTATSTPSQTATSTRTTTETPTRTRTQTRTKTPTQTPTATPTRTATSTRTTTKTSTKTSAPTSTTSTTKTTTPTSSETTATSTASTSSSTTNAATSTSDSSSASLSLVSVLRRFW